MHSQRFPKVLLSMFLLAGFLFSLQAVSVYAQNGMSAADASFSYDCPTLKLTGTHYPTQTSIVRPTSTPCYYPTTGGTATPRPTYNPMTLTAYATTHNQPTATTKVQSSSTPRPTYNPMTLTAYATRYNQPTATTKVQSTSTPRPTYNPMTLTAYATTHQK